MTSSSNSSNTQIAQFTVSSGEEAGNLITNTIISGNGMFIHVMPKISQKIKSYRILLQKEIDRCIDTFVGKKFEETPMGKMHGIILACKDLIEDSGFSESNIELIDYMINDLRNADGIDLELYTNYIRSITRFCNVLMNEKMGYAPY